MTPTNQLAEIERLKAELYDLQNLRKMEQAAHLDSYVLVQSELEITRAKIEEQKKVLEALARSKGCQTCHGLGTVEAHQLTTKRTLANHALRNHYRNVPCPKCALSSSENPPSPESNGI